ncbi:protein canopy homolog 2 isoform X1 [Protopterus annectens]|uniref:protein canopy homolog 2 isoform X1 n=1 Tax=Protopterus annectens TaxID=7888 RepID=UPI001CFB45E8|nr:protein canopy homolog 2 isoform X1 [Protopterus annectens]
MNRYIPLSVFGTLVLSLLGCLGARRSQDLACGACRALVDELEWEVSQVDPKKTIQIGSFRINPDGSQSVSEVPYARSESHLTELLEKICEKMKEYGEKIDSHTHRKTYVRVLTRDGTKMDLSETKFNEDVTAELKFAICVTMLSVYLMMNCEPHYSCLHRINRHIEPWVISRCCGSDSSSLTDFLFYKAETWKLELW